MHLFFLRKVIVYKIGNLQIVFNNWVHHYYQSGSKKPSIGGTLRLSYCCVNPGVPGGTTAREPHVVCPSVCQSARTSVLWLVRQITSPPSWPISEQSGSFRKYQTDVRWCASAGFGDQRNWRSEGGDNLRDKHRVGLMVVIASQEEGDHVADLHSSSIIISNVCRMKQPKLICVIFVHG